MCSSHKFIALIFLVSILNFLESNAQNCSIFAGNDTSLCSFPSVLNFDAVLIGPTSFCSIIQWSPQTGLSDPNILNPTATITSPISYNVSAYLPLGVNLIQNGDFESGNTGFTNSYIYNCPTAGNIQEGQYCITDNPQNVHAGAANCSDHTSGSGLMLVENGSTIANSEVWNQTIYVIPNTYYMFSFWGTNWSSTTSNLPVFDVKIDGINQSVSFSIAGLQCSWTNNCWLWYSGSLTSASFQIINEEDNYFGNDYCIDDIMLQEVCVAIDTIQIFSGGLMSFFEDTSVCAGSLVTLNAPNASDYEWSPSTGLSCSTCQTISFTADSTVTYIVSGTISLCGFTDTFLVEVDTLPFLNLPVDTFICSGNSLQILAESSSPIIWQASSSLSCLNCTDPIANPNSSTTYYASASNGTCISLDSITVEVNEGPLIQLIPDTNVCLGNAIIISLDTGYTYLWTPSDGLSCTNCSSPIATPDTTITYSITVTDSGCSSIDSVTIYISYEDQVDAGLNDSICEGENIQLLATGSYIYEWMPGFSLNNSDVNNPIASPNETTEYILHGIDACGESWDTLTIFVAKKPSVTVSYDSIIYCQSGLQINLIGQPEYEYYWLNSDISNPNASSVFVNPDISSIYSVTITNFGCDTILNFPVLVSEQEGFLVPNAFSPNGDGINDFFSILHYCPITLEYFRIFNRWGEMIFQTSNLEEGWNGSYKKEICPIGVYVYAISGRKATGEKLFLKGNVTLIR